MPPGTTGPLPAAIGPYIVIGKIGSGGMATVYRAYHPQGEREVALKVMAGHRASDDAARTRFEREGRALLQFSHPHILPVYDFGYDGDTPYLTMRLMSGQSLDDLLQGRPLGLPRLGRLTRQIASALDYAHARGIIHRDIKPENILLDDTGAPYLADFGVAYFAAYENERLTTQGSFVGTVAYASPEQCEGKPLDRPSDIYSLAIMVFEMATGRLPFEAASPLALMKLHLHAEPPNPLAYNPVLPIGLYDVLSRALAKLPEHRYPSAMKFSEALDQALGLHAVPQSSPSDEWLFGDITPVHPDESGDEWTPKDESPPDEPAQDDMLSLNAPPPKDSAPFPEDGGTFNTPADPFAGITPAEFAADSASHPFDDSFDDLFDVDEPWDEDDDFPPEDTFFAANSAAAYAAAYADEDADAFPSEESVLGRPSAPPLEDAPGPEPDHTTPGPIRPLDPRPSKPRRPIPWVRIGLVSIIVLSLLVIGSSVGVVIRELFPPPVRLDATYDAGSLGIRFDHPAEWHITPAVLGVLSAAPTPTVLLSDKAVTPGVSMGRATLVIAVQRIDAAAVYRVPEACAALIPRGPQPVFACMDRQNLNTPVYADFSTTRTQGAKLPGVLPPTRASLPVVLLPTGGAQWVALIIVYWNRYDGAQDVLNRVAKSVVVADQ